MAAEKQNEAKVSTVEENKENLQNGGLGLESILNSNKSVAIVLYFLQRICVRRNSSR